MLATTCAHSALVWAGCIKACTHPDSWSKASQNVGLRPPMSKPSIQMLIEAAASHQVLLQQRVIICRGALLVKLPRIHLLSCCCCTPALCLSNPLQQAHARTCVSYFSFQFTSSQTHQVHMTHTPWHHLVVLPVSTHNDGRTQDGPILMVRCRHVTPHPSSKLVAQGLSQGGSPARLLQWLALPRR
jgi:hypothetical protein